MHAFRRKIEKSLRTRGVIGSIRFGFAFCLERLKALTPRRRKALARVRALDDRFDLQYDVDTGGVIPLSELGVTSKNWLFGSRYQAVGADVDFARILGDLAITYEHFAFVDLGSGKGRAILLAAALPFKKIIGVEFSQVLTRIAENNVRRSLGQRRRCMEISLVNGDAGEYRLPAEPFILFMYNPFGPPVMDQVIANVRATYQNNPRRILVVYFTPKHASLWDTVEFLTRVISRPGYCIYDSLPAREFTALPSATDDLQSLRVGDSTMAVRVDLGSGM